MTPTPVPGTPPPLEVDDALAQAVVDVAAERDAKRSWSERFRDAMLYVRLILALLWRRRRA